MIALHAYYNQYLWDMKEGFWILYNDSWYKVKTILIVGEDGAYVYEHDYDLMIITCVNMHVWDQRMIIEADLWNGAILSQ